MATQTPSFFTSAWFIARKDVAQFMRIRETLLWVFVMPILYFYFIGTVTGGFGSPSGERRDSLAVTGGESGGLLIDELMKRLADEKFDVVRPAPEKWTEFDRRLTIPAPTGAHTNFTDAVLTGEQQTLTFEHRGDAMGGNYDQVRIARAVYEVVADLAVVRMSGGSPDADAFAKLHAMPHALTVAVRSAGKRREPPSGYSQAVPGNMVMFTMLVLLTSGAITLVVERREGRLRRLASAPISAGAVVLGKWTARMILGLIQIGFAMLVGRVIFGLDWGRSLPMVVLVLAGWAALTASLALLVSSLTRTEAQTAGVGILSSMLFGALGGCWWPIEITPAWMQKLSLAFPTGWTMTALHKLVNFGDPASSAIPFVTALAVTAIVVGWGAARAFKYS